MVNPPRLRRIRGFTLLEVLIAGAIFFGAVAVVSQAYLTVLSSSTRATAVAELMGPTILLREVIKSEISGKSDDEIQGAGTFENIDYRFTAKLRAAAAPPPAFDEETSLVREYEPRFRLYDVTLTVVLGRTQQTVIYQELSWLPLVAR
jgi:Tfp pilus assembly protein PilE